MSAPQLPTEMVDCITDLLRADPDALKACCLVSKSWIRRTRKHLFKCVDFKTPEDFGKWKRTFPNTVKSPAIHTRSLFFNDADKFTDVDVSWIQSFASVVQLKVAACQDHDYYGRPFSPFHGLSSAVKSLSMVWTDLPSREVFDFLCSFPHLVDLHVAGEGRIRDSGEDWTVLPLPPLTGSIVLGTSTPGFVCQLLEISSHLFFKEVVWQDNSMDAFKGVADLVERCSNVLECIDIDFEHQIDLSKATKLKQVRFWFSLYYGPEIVKTLNTIMPKHVHEGLKQVTIQLYQSSLVDAANCQQFDGCHWKNLDVTLVQFLKPHQTCVKVILYDSMFEDETTEKQNHASIKKLLPEVTKMMEGGIQLKLEHEKRSEPPFPQLFEVI